MKRDVKEEPHSTIRTFALICVAVTTLYVMAMGWWLNSTLASPNWCARALGAERASPGMTVKGLEACIDLLKIQLRSLATNSHILFGVVALCLLVLVVIVIAGGKLSFKGSKEGIEGNIGSNEPPPPPVVPPSVVQDAAKGAAAGAVTAAKEELPKP